jgi:hypothetical protein
MDPGAGTPPVVAEEAGETRHPLNDTWCYYEQRERDTSVDKYWSSRFLKAFTATSVEEFWAAYAHMPKIQQVFATPSGRGMVIRDCEKSDPPRKRRSGVEGYAFFREHVGKPDNRKKDEEGVLFSVTRVMAKKRVPGEDDAEEWEKAWKVVMLAVMGEVEPWTKHVTGVVLLDKGTKGRFEFRLEVWLSKKDDELLETVANSLRRHIADNADFRLRLEPHPFRSKH